MASHNWFSTTLNVWGFDKTYGEVLIWDFTAIVMRRHVSGLLASVLVVATFLVCVATVKVTYL